MFGSCAEPCGGEVPCPGAEICVPIGGEYLCVTDVCDPVNSEVLLPCVDDESYCDDGYVPPCECNSWPPLCVDSCYGVECPPGGVCLPELGGECFFEL